MISPLHEKIIRAQAETAVSVVMDHLAEMGLVVKPHVPLLEIHQAHDRESLARLLQWCLPRLKREAYALALRDAAANPIVKSE